MTPDTRVRVGSIELANPIMTASGTAGYGDEFAGYFDLASIGAIVTKSLAAFANLKRMCEEHLPGRYSIEVVDLLKDPQLAAGDQILAIPTLVRKVPAPIRKIIGDLSNTEKFLVGFDLKAGTG